MARPTKQTADYFPHYSVWGKTLFILDKKWGNDGYAFWFKLLELLCRTDGHAYDASSPDGMEYLVALALMDESQVIEILTHLAKMGNIDNDLWVKKRIIWCQNLLDNLADLYTKRKDAAPQKPSL